MQELVLAEIDSLKKMLLKTRINVNKTIEIMIVFISIKSIEDLSNC